MKMQFLFFSILFGAFTSVNAQQKTFNLQQFSFEDTAGKKFNLDALKGKVVYVDCWFPNCPPCRAEMPYSTQLQQRLQTMQMDSNIIFVTICFKQTTQEWKDALNKLPMPKAIHLYSPASTYEIAMAGGNYPTYRIFNSNGQLELSNAPRPSEFLLADFVLFAVTKGESVTNATKIFEAEKQVANNKVTHKLLQAFYAIELKYHKEFTEQFLQLK